MYWYVLHSYVALSMYYCISMYWTYCTSVFIYLRVLIGISQYRYWSVLFVMLRHRQGFLCSVAFALGQSEEAQAVWDPNLNCTSRLLLNCPSGRQVSSAQQLEFVYLLQSLEHSIQFIETRASSQVDYLRRSLPDSLSYVLSGCLTHFQCFQWHQGPCRTTAYMPVSPQ